MISKIFDECEIRYKGEVISREVILKDFAMRMETLSLSPDHKVGVMLHTGSIAFSIVSAVTAIVLCITEDFKSTEDIVKELQIGDIVLYEKKRAKYLGEKEISKSRCYGFCVDEKTSLNEFISCEKINQKKVIPYSGSAKYLGGIGVKKQAFSARMEFIKYLWGADENELSSLITKSFAFILDKDTAQDIYEKTSVYFLGKNYYLKDLVTASYFTEDKDYIWGSNPGKEQPTLMFFSNIDDARQKLIEDSNGERRILGVIVVGNEYLRSGNGMDNLLGRQSTKSAYFSGKLDYSKSYGDFVGETAEYWTLTPKKTAESVTRSTIHRGMILEELQNGVSALAAPPIARVVLHGAVDIDKYRQIRRALTTLKNSGQQLSDFIARSFSLLNLFLGAVFPLGALDKSVEKGKIPRVESIRTKLDGLSKSTEGLFGNEKTEGQLVVALLTEIYSSLLNSNPKGDYFLELIKNRKLPDVLVVPKAYFAVVLFDWLSEQDLAQGDRAAASLLKIKTIGDLKFSGEIYKNIIYACSNFGEINPYTLLIAERRSLLLYDCEIGRVSQQEKTFTKFKFDTLIRLGETTVEPEAEVVVALTEEEIEELNFDTAINTILSENVRRFAGRASADFGSTMQSEVTRIAEFSGDEYVVYFTKHASVYRLCDGKIEDVEAEKIMSGDMLLFSNASEGRDLFNVIILKLFEDSEDARRQYEKEYLLSKIWRIKLKLFLYKIGGSEFFAKQLTKKGIIRDFVTIRQWADEDSHIIGPRSSEAVAIFRAIGEIMDDEEIIQNAQAIADACRIIRALRGRVLDAIKKAVINKHAGVELDPLFAPVMDKIENLATLLQVDKITEYDGKMPSHFTNRPIIIHGIEAVTL